MMQKAQETHNGIQSETYQYSIHIRDNNPFCTSRSCALFSVFENAFVIIVRKKQCYSSSPLHMALWNSWAFRSVYKNDVDREKTFDFLIKSMQAITVIISV
jgi:hypothetical protein